MFKNFFANIDALSDSNLVIDAELVQACKQSDIDTDSVFTLSVLKNRSTVQYIVRLLRSSVNARFNKFDFALLVHFQNTRQALLLSDVIKSQKECVYISRALIALKIATYDKNTKLHTFDFDNKLFKVLLDAVYYELDFHAQEE